MQNQTGILSKVKNILAIISLGLLSIILMLLILSGLGINLFQEPNVQKVTIVGHSEEFIVPSFVQINAYISANSSDKNEAMRQVTTAESKVLSELKIMNISESDIVRPSSITTQSNGKYSVSNTITFVLRDIKKYNQLESVRSIPNVSYVDQDKSQLQAFSVVDNALRDKLIAEATSDARTQVENNAKLLNGKVGKVIGFDNVVKIESYRVASLENVPGLDPISLKLGYYVTASATISYKVEF